MRERLAAFTQELSARMGPLAARARSASARAWAAVVRWGGVAGRETWRAAKAFAAFSMRVAAAILLAIETTLLSARGRERVHAMSVFALIFAFAVTSVDMLVTGGPDIIASASAASAPTPRVDLIAATSERSDADAAIALASLDTSDGPVDVNLVEAAAPLAITPAALPARQASPVPELLDAEPVKTYNDEAAAAISAADAKIKDDETEA